MDQIHRDLRHPRSLELHKATRAAEDLPGLGQFYCIECAKYFDTDFAEREHKRGKRHKRRCRMLKEPPYTQAEAEAAAGIGVDKGRGHEMPEPLYMQSARIAMEVEEMSRTKKSIEQAKVKEMEVELLAPIDMTAPEPQAAPSANEEEIDDIL